MNALVFVENNRPVTDSLTVADAFGKNHADVLRDIRNLGCSEEFRLSNFAESHYVNHQGRKMPRVVLAEQGFVLLAMGYTGPKAMEFKERYITEFERMKTALQEQSKPRELTRLELIELARESELARLEAEQKNAELEYQLRIQEPKVALYDVAMNANNAQPVGTIAKTLGVGPYKLFAFLRDKRIFFKRRRDNLPYQEYIDRGYFTVRQYPVMHNTTGIENKPQILVTAKGMDFINRLLEQEKAVVAQ